MTSPLLRRPKIGANGLPCRLSSSCTFAVWGERSPALLGGARRDRGTASESEPVPRKIQGARVPREPSSPIATRTYRRRRNRARPTSASKRYPDGETVRDRATEQKPPPRSFGVSAEGSGSLVTGGAASSAGETATSV